METCALDRQNRMYEPNSALRWTFAQIVSGVKDEVLQSETIKHDRLLCPYIFEYDNVQY